MLLRPGTTGPRSLHDDEPSLFFAERGRGEELRGDRKRVRYRMTLLLRSPGMSAVVAREPERDRGEKKEWRAKRGSHRHKSGHGGTSGGRVETAGGRVEVAKRETVCVHHAQNRIIGHTGHTPKVWGVLPHRLILNIP